MSHYTETMWGNMTWMISLISIISRHLKIMLMGYLAGHLRKKRSMRKSPENSTSGNREKLYQKMGSLLVARMTGVRDMTMITPTIANRSSAAESTQ